MSSELSALTGKSNYFEDFAVGEVYEHARGKTVEALENVLITNLVLNTAQAHFNEHLAQTLPQGHRITFGGVTASIVIGLAMQDTGENAVEEVGLNKVRFRVPVLHGDTLYAFTEVVNKEEPADVRGHRNVGLLHLKHWGINQRGETVFEGERRVLVKKRAFSTAGLEPPDEENIPISKAKRVARKSPAPKRPIAAQAKMRSAKRARPMPKISAKAKQRVSKPRRRGR
ncbi:MAG TPA: MaoC family dehydratase [Candidatus Binataceae bacterium]|nr:MaoC family dehydratase [Candidatus Binataceae bacterium]